jgi:deoxyribonuclease-4
MNAYEEWKRVLTRYRRVLGAASLKRLHCHLSGIEYTSRGERKHLMLADSDFDLPGLIRALAELKCGGRIVCESPVMDEDAHLIQKTWERSVRRLG